MNFKKTLRSTLFKSSYLLVLKPSVLKYYNHFMETQWWPIDRLIEYQETQLHKLVKFAYEQVPYYYNIFSKIGLKPDDIRRIKDLQKIPILTKEIIRKHWQEFFPHNIKDFKYINGSTGGATGEPLRYRISKDDYSMGVALLLRGWGYGGYRIGDSVAIVAGSSLIPNKKYDTRNFLISIFRNIRFYSSYGISDNRLIKYLESLNKFKPLFLRGYASSIYLLASFIRENDFTLSFRPKAIFTTSEKLLDKQRKTIEEVFGTKVFDGYGLNDGGVSAFECEKHNGMHIDFERSIMEVVNEYGEPVIGQPGKILATSLHNYAFPFIRYDTGDIGLLEESKCLCGRQMSLLKEISGRTTDILEVKGRKIGSPVLTVLMGKFDIEQYQIIQDIDDKLIIKIVKGREFKKEDEIFIKKSLLAHLGSVNIEFQYCKLIKPIDGNKHKFIIREK